MFMFPFDTEPSINYKVIGDSAAGTVRFPCYGSLLVKEQIEIDRYLNEVSPFTLAAELAIKIAEQQQLNLLLCSQIVIGGNDFTDDESISIIKENRIRYSRDIEKVNNYSESFSEKEKLITVTVLCKRLNPNFTEKDTVDLRISLFNAIWAFAQEEITGRNLQTLTQMTEEAIKKPQLQEEEPAIALTGQTSSGG